MRGGFPEDVPPRGGSGERREGVFSFLPVRQKRLRVDGEGDGAGPRGSPPISPPTITEGPSRSRGGSALSKQQRGEGPPGSSISAVSLGLSLRGTAAFIEARLATSVHPNPGPGVRRGRRGRGEGNRRDRCSRRYQRRRERANTRRERANTRRERANTRRDRANTRREGDSSRREGGERIRNRGGVRNSNVERPRVVGEGEK